VIIKVRNALVEFETNPSMSMVCAICLLACGVQVLSSEAMVDGEGGGQAGPCRWTWSGEGRTPKAWTEGPEKMDE